jgi:hypothetical protein
MQRNRTRKVGGTNEESEDLGGVAAAAQQPIPQYAMDTKLEEFLNLNASEAYKRPWHRLERGLRLNRLRRFIESEKTRMNLSEVDTELLRSRLEKAFDKKLLNSKTAVVYDPTTEAIQEIKGLVYHKSADGRMLSNLVDKKVGVTFRRKASAAAAQAQAQQQNVNGAPA